MHARVLVGIHGAGLTSQLHLPTSNSAVLEVGPLPSPHSPGSLITTPTSACRFPSRTAANGRMASECTILGRFTVNHEQGAARR